MSVALFCSSKKLCFASHRDHYRKPQLSKIQRTSDCGVPSLRGSIYIQYKPHTPVREHLGRGDRKTVRASEQRLSAVRLSSRNGREATTMIP